MNEMMDQLEQVIEERVMQLKGKMEEEKSQTDQAEKEEYSVKESRGQPKNGTLKQAIEK